MTIQSYNPLDKRNLGESVARELLASDLLSLPIEHQFDGAGVYAIYYTGQNMPFAPYSSLTEYQEETERSPIYVGKAVPKGARMGGYGLGAGPGKVLYLRLREHAESISQACNLDIRDFRCRVLVVDDIWIPLAENILIELFSPLWNTMVAGFGNHDPGRGRYNQQKSLWDELHPGRPWAEKVKGKAKKSFEEISLLVTNHLSSDAKP